MISTDKNTARLATHRIDREALTRGYRSGALMARLSTEGPRLAALQRLCQGAHRKPAWLYNVQRAEPRSSLPCERLDAAITQGIADGYITPETLADYFGDLFTIYCTQMSATGDACYLDAAREKAEAMEAAAMARAVPTAENRERAVKELAEDVIVSLAHAKQLQRASA